MLSDIEIARKAEKFPVGKIAAKLKINSRYLIPYGKFIAKIDTGILNEIRGRRRGKYILVTAITPTPLGEGKTVTTIGLSMALNRLGVLATTCLRQPSLGPVFGIKGSAGGGGYSQVLPREDFDLHFTGDAHAVGLAHNIAAAFLDNSLFGGNPLGIDINRIYWRRCVDIGDRFLRKIRIGLGSPLDGIPRESGFDITASSEIMALLALSRDLNDLRRRCHKVILALDKKGRAITTGDINVSGLMAVLLKDAVKPNLIQTIEKTPCFVHTGPFANIAHGSSSLIQDEIALALSDYCVTEAGFGADCGAEKFFNIKCRAAGLAPDAAVLVCSLRAMKAYGLIKGFENLKKQIGNVKIFGIPVVVAINKFDSDPQRELNLIKEAALESGADDCQISEVWRKGGQGGVDLARSVIRLSRMKSKFKFLYPLDLGIKKKIGIIAAKIYGSKGIRYSPLAEEKIRLYTRLGFAKLPVCMAKTHLSLTEDPKIKGAPKGFMLHIRDVRVFAGAGFLSPLCGKIQTMPGLPRHPRGENIDIDKYGNITGLA